MSILGIFGISGNSGRDKLGIDRPSGGIGRLGLGKGGRGGTANGEILALTPSPFNPIFGIPGIFGRLGAGMSGSFGNSGNSGIDKLGSDGPKDGIGRLGLGKGGRGGMATADTLASTPVPFKDIFGEPGTFGILGGSILGNFGSSGSSGKLKLGMLIPKLGIGSSGIGMENEVSDICFPSLKTLNVKTVDGIYITPLI
jgi:hypothetical protein